ncbi:integrin alpha [Engelhardtia mirabilis]|uniref:FG-GAP repeat protein n=1 Tax=Engelhardtia mirabilis TaxID=2528011 RepID=A0A518BEB3_9BACT|nr:FG-GAP repeat protein [Planctomycetes bacterium Pla133]QDU99549.1 FG-GAP repeat protein [Planctomycetes bacterium Pla86]
MLLRTLFTCAALAPALAAQSAPIQLQGQDADDRFGESIAFVGDLDGDGLSELAVGAPGKQSSSTQTVGTVSLFSGANGRELGVAFGALAGTGFGARIAPSRDLSGDGVPDLLVGAPDADRVVAIDGASFAAGNPAPLWSNDGEPNGQFGRALDSIGDQTGDGVPDLAVGAPFGGGDIAGFGPGQVWLLSGATGRSFGVLSAPGADNGSFGWSLANVGDVNGDGRDDLAVGAPLDDGVATAVGAVYLFSPATDAPLTSWFGRRAGDDFGHALERGPDVSGDGVASLFIGAPASTIAPPTAGSVLWLELSNGQRLAQFSAPTVGGRFGWALASDGAGQLAVGEPLAPASIESIGMVHTFDLRTASSSVVAGSQGEAEFGATLAWNPAADVSSSDVLAIGAPFFDVEFGSDEGQVDLYLN